MLLPGAMASGGPSTARRLGQEVDKLRQALSPLGRYAQDGDDEGIIRIDQLPNPEQAAVIRKAIGLAKRPDRAPETYQFQPASLGGSRHQQAISHLPLPPAPLKEIA